jgi:hypothetical protein
MIRLQGDSRIQQTRIGLHSIAERRVLADDKIRELLRLAGVPPSDEEAARWLSKAIVGARQNYKAAQNRLLPADHNALLVDIEKTAKRLTKRIERLRQKPGSWRAFWHSPIFGPVHYDRVEVREVLFAIEKIIGAASSEKDLRQGRRRETGKQHVTDLAIAFFVRFSPYKASGTRTGSFAKFARNFYSAAIETDPEQHGGLDRQIRQALTRLPIERERARRKSFEKPKVSS